MATPTDNELLDNYLNNSNPTPSTAHGPIPGLEFLGMGYDIFGRYASIDSCKQNILDLSSEPQVDQQVMDASLQLQVIQQAFNQIPTEIHLVYTRPVTVQYLPRFEVRSVNEFESTIDDQITKWSAHVNVTGNYGAFAGEIDARFSSTLAKLATTKYYSLVSKSTYWQLDLRYTHGNPPPLRADIREDLDNPSFQPEEFFANYGTHYLSSVLIGCKVAVSCAIETSRAESDFDFAAYLSATYGGRNASVSGTVDGTYQNKVKRFREYSKTTVFGVGITDQQLDNIKEGTEAGVSVLKGGWHNPSLIDFSANALKPIWTFCKDAARRDAFQAAFNNLAAHRTSIISSYSLYSPLYLHRAEVNFNVPGPGGAAVKAVTYRLYPTTTLAGSSDAGGIPWQIQNNGKPLLNVAARQIEGTIPLYEYRFRNSPVRRYETSAWQPNDDNEVRRSWERVSSRPIGYVLDPTKIQGRLGDGVCPVYGYLEKNHPCVFYYSLDEEDNTRAPAESWMRFDPLDDIWWRALPGSNRGFNGSPAPKPDALWYAWSPEQ
jgi:hypothetical protein